MALATSGTRRERIREQTRREILDAAWALAAEHGLAAMSLRDIGRRVGMRAPSLYTYFPSKDAIYDAMFAEGYEALDRAMDALPPGASAQELLSEGLKLFLAFCNNHPTRYQLMFQRTIPGFEPSPEAYASSLRSFERLSRMLAEIGITDPADVDLFTSVSSGLAAQQLANDPGGDRWIRLAPRAVEMYLSDVRRRKRKEKRR